jgi:hypothetical protein
MTYRRFFFGLNIFLLNNRLLVGILSSLWIGIIATSVYLRSYDEKIQQQLRSMQLLKEQKLESIPNPSKQINQTEELGQLLTPVTHLQRALETIYDIEAESGLNVTNASYRLRELDNFKFGAVDIQFSTKSDYPTLRSFIEKLLLALPSASISELGFKRDNIQTNLLDVKCKITLIVTMKVDARGSWVEK